MDVRTKTGSTSLSREQRLVSLESFRRLVKKFANHYANKSKGYFEFDDLEQIGLMGLWRATKTYSDVSGSEASYYSICIRNEILHYIQNNKRKLETVPYDPSSEMSQYSEEPEVYSFYKYLNEVVSETKLLKNERNVVEMVKSGTRLTTYARELKVSSTRIYEIRDSACYKIKLKMLSL
jgi:RNA polymerase sigma factor (sigma-70 family)